MPPVSRYTYDETRGQYRDRVTGRWVSADAVRAELDAVLAREAKAMQQLGEQLRARTISPARFELAMRERIKSMQLASAALAKGGWAQMSPADYGRAGASIKAQYQYLRRLVQQVQRGTQPRDGRLIRRLGMYGTAARATFEDVQRREMAARGMTEEMSVRFALDSCETEGDVMGCIEAAAAGWQPIGTLPLPGSRVCLTNCQCKLTFR